MSVQEWELVPRRNTVSYLRTFAPWIVYAVIPGAHWQWGALAALAVSVAVVAEQTRSGRPMRAQILEIGSAVFFTVLTVVAFVAPDSGVHPYAPALSAGALALIAGTSLLIGKPFTLGIAKQTTPPEFWDQPMFLRANVVLSSVWTASFVIGCAATAAAHAAPAARTAVQVAVFAAPLIFTLRYVARVRARVAELARPAA
jgi:hypothetical protein